MAIQRVHGRICVHGWPESGQNCPICVYTCQITFSNRSRLPLVVLVAADMLGLLGCGGLIFIVTAAVGFRVLHFSLWFWRTAAICNRTRHTVKSNYVHAHTSKIDKICKGTTL